MKQEVVLPVLVPAFVYDHESTCSITFLAVKQEVVLPVLAFAFIIHVFQVVWGAGVACPTHASPAHAQWCTLPEARPRWRLGFTYEALMSG